MVVYWMMIFWLKQSDTWKLKQSDTCVNSGLLNDDTLIKTKVIQSDTCVNGGLLNDDTLIKKGDTCVNSGLLNDDILIKTKWYLEIKTKWYLCQ